MFFTWLGWIAFGFLIAYLVFHWQNYHAIRERVHRWAARKGVVHVRDAPVWARLYRSLTWRKESRLVGHIACTKVPTIFRTMLFNAYIKYFNVDMSDVEEQDLTKYSSLNQFFSRPLRAGARPIADTSLVSPADCHCYHYGKLHDDVVKDIKGFNYDLHAFFGKDVVEKVNTKLHDHPDTALWYCVCYLSPSDYHRFHSPVDWTVDFRRHFTGHLLGVSERIVNCVSDLFDVNERMLLTGEWEHGFFSLTAVGATNVGAIELDFDDRRTNIRVERVGTYDDKEYLTPIQKKRGDSFGHFLFGSTLVLVFQAPNLFKFKLSRGQNIKVGEAIGEELELDG